MDLLEDSRIGTRQICVQEDIDIDRCQGPVASIRNNMYIINISPMMIHANILHIYIYMPAL